jgi:hypothetical protein
MLYSVKMHGTAVKIMVGVFNMNILGINSVKIINNKFTISLTVPEFLIRILSLIE